MWPGGSARSCCAAQTSFAARGPGAHESGTCTAMAHMHPARCRGGFAQTLTNIGGVCQVRGGRVEVAVRSTSTCRHHSHPYQYDPTEFNTMLSAVRDSSYATGANFQEMALAICRMSCVCRRNS